MKHVRHYGYILHYFFMMNLTLLHGYDVKQQVTLLILSKKGNDNPKPWHSHRIYLLPTVTRQAGRTICCVPAFIYKSIRSKDKFTMRPNIQLKNIKHRNRKNCDRTKNLTHVHKIWRPYLEIKTAPVSCRFTKVAQY